jgi:3-methyl-2-oxobutanoate hydroxymethyltransferase
MDLREKIQRLQKKKGAGRIAAVTAYDYPTAKLASEVGIDLLLVGDSVGVVVLGYETPLSVTMEEMLHHVRAVRRGNRDPLLIADMPAHSYDTEEEALKNAHRFLEAGAEGVKIEGARAEIVRILREGEIPVVGHLGLTPQTIQEYRVQGRDRESAKRLLREAKALEKAGIIALVLECVPEGLGKAITEALAVPTIGIGAGRHTDGQILVLHDLLGLFDRYLPKFVKRYADLGTEVRSALRRYKKEVEAGEFPGEENVFL